MHVVKERDDGIVVCGARMVSTGAAFGHVTYMGQYIQSAGLAENEEDFLDDQSKDGENAVDNEKQKEKDKEQ